MRCSKLFSIPVMAQSSLAQYFYRDHRETNDCVSWGNVGDSSKQKCEDFLHKHSLEPVRFNAWNPSVGVDCTPWHDNRTYCVLTNAEIADSVNRTTLYGSHFPTEGVPLPSLTTDKDGWEIPITRSDAPARTTSTRAPIPSPAVWKNMGCFVDDKIDLDIAPQLWTWILDMRWIPKFLNETMEKCKQRCWEISYPVAGVKGGNECFCGDRNNGTLADDQSECNIRCDGDESVICGGTNRTSVWEAGDYVQSTATATTGSSAGDGLGSRSDTNRVTATETSGARRNVAMFWQL